MNLTKAIASKNKYFYFLRDISTKFYDYSPEGKTYFKHAQYLLTRYMRGDFKVRTYSDKGEKDHTEICTLLENNYRNRKYPYGSTLKQRRKQPK